jgi:membrane-bound serine protease (ClpP class)
MNLRAHGLAWLILSLTGLGVALAQPAAGAALGASAGDLREMTPATAAMIEIQGAIGPATSGYFEKAHRQAVDSGASLIVLQMDTPGGLDTAMRDIIKLILNSPIPVACIVAPGGARAASAGTYILYACHVAAMAPATNLGAATPVPIGGSFPGMGKEDKDKKPEDGKAGESKPAEESPPEGDDAMARKVINDAVAYIRSLAEKRGRNADWAEKAVREGASLSAEKALEAKVIDLMANDVADLLKKIDGRKVATPAGEIVLKSAALAVQKIEPDWRMKFLSIITNPTVAYVLMLIGIYGLLLEGYHPGAIVPGVVGAICLLLAMFAFQVLPVNYVGLALIILGVVLMIAEALVPSFGAMGFGGIAAFIIGSIMLMDIDVPGYGVNRGLIFGIAAGASGILALTLYLLWRSRKAPVVTGDRTLVGHTVEIMEAIESEGWAWVAGERWRVRTRIPLKTGDKPRVVAMDGLTLIVEPEAK